MKNTKLNLRAIALLTALFLVALALPQTGSMAAAASIPVTITIADHNEGNAENWQEVGTFTIDSSDIPMTSAQLTIIAYDVDAPDETDRIRIRKVSDGSTAMLGRLTGMNGQSNTTVLDVPAAFLTAGGYILEMDMGTTTNGVLTYEQDWVVSIQSAVLLLDGGVASIGASVSFTAAGTAVDTTLDLSSLTSGETYNLEYKFINLTTAEQIASAADTYTATAATAQILKTLTLAAADAIVDTDAYQLDVVITNGNDITTARATRGTQDAVVYTYYKITIITNEGGTTDPFTPVYAIENENSPAIHFNANAGFAVGNVIVDGMSMGALESYMFENVTANHTVEVEFVPIASPPQTGSSTMIGLAILTILCSAGCFVWARKKS